MEINLQDIIKERIEQFNADPKKALKVKGIEYNKEYAKAIKCFQDRVNKDRKKAGQAPLPFMAIKMRLAAVREIDDLRAFYKICCDYKYKAKGNTFTKAFMGATKVR